MAKTRRAAPAVQPATAHSWWTTLPGVLTAVGGVIGAGAALLTALHSTGLIPRLSTGAAASAPVGNIAGPPAGSSASAPGGNIRTSTPRAMPLNVGWMYVGVRVNGAWAITPEETHEPPVTIDVVGLPQTGRSYRVTSNVFLRNEAPRAEAIGTRPVMGEARSWIAQNSRVKIDQVHDYPLTEPKRTWYFAHVTLLADD